jgi:hypothetical protein
MRPAGVTSQATSISCVVWACTRVARHSLRVQGVITNRLCSNSLLLGANDLALEVNIDVTELLQCVANMSGKLFGQFLRKVAILCENVIGEWISLKLTV